MKPVKNFINKLIGKKQTEVLPSGGANKLFLVRLDTTTMLCLDKSKFHVAAKLKAKDNKFFTENGELYYDWGSQQDKVPIEEINLDGQPRVIKIFREG